MRPLLTESFTEPDLLLRELGGSLSFPELILFSVSKNFSGGRVLRKRSKRRSSESSRPSIESGQSCASSTRPPLLGTAPNVDPETKTPWCSESVHTVVLSSDPPVVRPEENGVLSRLGADGCNLVCHLPNFATDDLQPCMTDARLRLHDPATESILWPADLREAVDDRRLQDSGDDEYVLECPLIPRVVSTNLGSMRKSRT